MTWGMGGGMGGPGGGGLGAIGSGPGRPGVPGLPFAGIPSELQTGVDKLLATEPDYAEPDYVFSHTASEAELRKLSLWRLMRKYPGMLALAGLLIVIIAVASQEGPQLIQIAIDDGLNVKHPNFALVVVVAVAYLVFVAITAISQRAQVKVTGAWPPGS